MVVALDYRICDVGQRGIFLPLIDSEQEWPTAVRAPLYLVGLGWCFLGVAIVSDVFMSAIERITSKKVRKLCPDTGKLRTVSVWNATVANLTLMSLGSSAPEILLNVIDLFSANFYSAELGPSTIVGSAAFNLFIIIAVCISAIECGDTRKIKEFNVYLLTAVFSVGAYVWLLLILTLWSPNIVEPWEGTLTFLYFPLLVVLAYMTDRGFFSPTGQSPTHVSRIMTAEMTMEELAELESKVRRKHGASLTDEQLMKLMDIECSVQPSRAQMRVAATRGITGGKRVKMPRISFKGSKVVPEAEAPTEKAAPDTDTAIIEFSAQRYAALENAGEVAIQVNRTGNLDVTAVVYFKTRDGTAKAEKHGLAEADFKHIEGELKFMPGETEQHIRVELIDDLAYEEDEDFFVDLTLIPQVTDPRVKLGDQHIATVVIIDDDLPGVLGFPEDQVTFHQECEDRDVNLLVCRTNGGCGTIKCKYYTEDHNAFAGRDYDEAKGEVVFESGQLSAIIPLTLKAVGRFDSTDMFRIVLTDPEGGAKFDKNTDGGEDTCILTVVLGVESETKERLQRMKSNLVRNWDKSKVGHANWKAQFVEAISVNGGDEDADDPGISDYAMHVVTVPWKLLFALCPPTDYWGGWLCFVSSLGMIGLVTAIISDLASLLGCVLAISDQITAITFVALGTSLPDTFASKAAALQDPTADASICNVTGSNSVNVFLGLGLPWTIGSIYWTINGANDEWTMRYGNEAYAKDFTGSFVVEAGGLSFSVGVFSMGAAFALALLHWRRNFCGGELGGPQPQKAISSGVLVLLWFTYISMSCWYVASNEE